MKEKNNIQIFLCLFSLISLLPAISCAQVIERESSESSFHARTGFAVDKKITKGLHLKWSEELRMKENATEVDRIYSVLTLSYNILSWLEAGVDYTFISVKKPDGWEFRNRSNIELTFTWEPTDRWEFSLRERFRITSTNKEFDPLTEANPSWIMRSRAMAQYSLRNAPLKPYIFFELSNTLNAPNITGNYVDKIRWSAGVKYTVSKRSEIDIFYRFDHNRDKAISLPTDHAPLTITTEKANNHILGIFYEYSF